MSFFVVFQNLADAEWHSTEHAVTSRLQAEPTKEVLGSTSLPATITAKARVHHSRIE